MGQARPFRIALSSLWMAAAFLTPRFAQAISVAGDLTYTTDYMFRGISETDGRGAEQLDVHATTNGRTFIGVFGSTLGKMHAPKWSGGWNRGWDHEVEAYLGHRFDLSQSLSTTITAVNYSYLGGHVPMSNDYQELSASVSYLDRWTLSVASSPNAVRYFKGQRLGRDPGYVADASVQLPLIGRLFVTGAIGYYSLVGPHAGAYVYGNTGFSFEYKALRIDADYYMTQEHAQLLFPYGEANNRFAGTLSWHF